MLNKRFFVLLGMILFVMACAKVPITGRRQVNLLPESQLMTMSLTSYKQFLSENKTVAVNNDKSAMVSRVGKKIASACTAYLKQEGQSKRVKGFQWEFNLVEDQLVNAWCMPGGKVVVYTGILPVCVDEAGLAVVMGHEIAHAIARHGNERMSQQLVTTMGGIGLGVALSQKPQETQQIFQMAYGATASIGMLAYSRNHESEADKMGLVFMAMAGYNPEVAVSFWERMDAMAGKRPPEFLSTHPSGQTRIQRIKEFLPEARRYYKASK